MASQLTIVNNVLRRLREDTVSTVSQNAYSQLIGMWVNDGFRQVQEAYDWQSLRHEINLPVAIGQTEYDLSATVANGGSVPNTERVTTADSLLLWDEDNRPQAYMFDDASDRYRKSFLWLIEDVSRYRRQQGDREIDNVRPQHFSLTPATDGDGLVLTLWPDPSATSLIRIRFQTPQAELAIDGTDNATDIIVPQTPVEAYVHFIASNERGEEMGEPGNILENRFTMALGAAIESAMGPDVRSDRYESYRA